MARGKEALALGLAALFIGAAPAHAACDLPVRKARPAKVPHGERAPLAIGDSTMIFAVKELAKRGVEADARVCRDWSEGLEIIRDRKRRGRLPSYVVMALGANSTVRPIDVERALELIGPDRRLGLVTHRTWFGKPGPDTRTIRRMARKYRNRVVLIDWVAYSGPHKAWFVIDGLHTNAIGARKFAMLISRSRPTE